MTESKNTRSWTAAPVIFFAVALVCCVFLVFFIYRQLYNNSTVAMQNAALEFDDTLQARLDSSLHLVSLAGSSLLQAGPVTEAEELSASGAQLLASLAEEGGFARAGLYLPGGKCFFSDGSSTSANQFSFYESGLAAPQATTGDFYPLSRKKLFVVSCPGYDEAGVLRFVVFAAFDGASVAGSSSSVLFDGTGFGAILDSVGDVMVSSGSAAWPLGEGNLWNNLSTARFSLGSSMNEVKQSVKAESSGSFRCSDGESSLVICYVPSSVDGWYVMTAQPARVADNKAGTAALLICAAFTILFTAFVVFTAFGRRSQHNSRQQILRAVQKLRISDQRFRISSDLLGSVVFEYEHSSGSIVFASEAARRLLGLGEVTPNVPECFFTEDSPVDSEYHEALSELYRQIDMGEESATCEILCRLPDGGESWQSIQLINIFDDYDRPVRAIGVGRDVTEYKRLMSEKSIGERCRKILLSDSASSLEMDFTADSAVYVQDGLRLRFGSEQSQSLYQALSTLAIDCLHPEDRADFIRLCAPASVCSAYEEGRRGLRATVRMRGQSETVWRWHELIFLLSAGDDGHVLGRGILRDIDDKVRQELSLREAAEQDALTGLYNRTALNTKVTEALQSAPDKMHAFMIVDLDRFSEVNEKYGRPRGDKLLKNVGKRLRRSLPGSAVAGRLSGDEFVVFLPDVASPEYVSEVSCRICTAVYSRQRAGTDIFTVSCSVGAALAPYHGTNWSELYLQADKALYFAKQRGSGSCAMYRPTTLTAQQSDDGAQSVGKTVPGPGEALREA